MIGAPATSSQKCKVGVERGAQGTSVSEAIPNIAMIYQIISLYIKVRYIYIHSHIINYISCFLLCYVFFFIVKLTVYLLDIDNITCQLNNNYMLSSNLMWIQHNHILLTPSFSKKVACAVLYFIHIPYSMAFNPNFTFGIPVPIHNNGSPLPLSVKGNYVYN